MNKLINLVLTAALWRNYKFMILSVLALIVSVFVIGLIHDDYVQWAQYQLSQDNVSLPLSVGWSFIIKYLVYLLAICICFYANKWVNNKKALEKAVKGDDNSVLKKILASAKAKSSSSISPSPTEDKDSKANVKNIKPDASLDAFANIRAKQSLRTQADILIQKKKSK